MARALSIVFSLTATAAAFCSQSRRPRKANVLSMASQPEETSFMTAYYAQAHREKLRAIADLEAEKNEEISDLKSQIEELKGPKDMTGSDYLSSLSTDELAEKLALYQDMVADFVVQVPEEQFLAVKQAKEAVNQKWEDKVKELF